MPSTGNRSAELERAEIRLRSARDGLAACWVAIRHVASHGPCRTMHRKIRVRLEDAQHREAEIATLTAHVAHLKGAGPRFHRSPTGA